MAAAALALQLLDITLDRLASAHLALADDRYSRALKHIQHARRLLDRLDALCTAAAAPHRKDRAAHAANPPAESDHADAPPPGSTR